MEPNAEAEKTFRENAEDIAAPAAASLNAETPAVEIAMDALLTSAKAGNYDEARRLLSAGANVNNLNEQRESALTLALGNYDVRLTRLFLHAGADVAKYEDMTGKSLLSVLRHAGTSFKPEEEILACLLLDHGAAADVRDNQGLPLVARYASLGMAQAVERIITAGANPNALSPSSNTSALYFAISGEGKPLALIDTLLSGGANPNGAEGETTLPLFLAVRQKNLGAAALLLEKGADPDRISPSHGMSPLLQALKNNQPEMVDLLVQHGADPHARQHDGLRVLDTLVRDNADIAIVEKALQIGARGDVHRLDDDGAPVETPLHMAVRNKRLEMINLMLKHGADPLCVDGFGYTPLQLAHSTLPAEDPIIDRLRLADGAARIERERAARAAAVDTPPAGKPRPPQPPAP